MNASHSAIALVVACLLATAVVPVAGHASDASPEQERTDVENATNPGVALSNTVLHHEARVGGSLHAAVLDADMATASSDRVRARRLATFDATLERLLDLLTEDDAPRRDDGRTHGSASGAWISPRTATALATRDLAARANATAADLSPNATEDAGVTDADFREHERWSEAIVRNETDESREDGAADDRNETGYDWHDDEFLLTDGEDEFESSSEGYEPWREPHDWDREGDWSHTGYEHGWTSFDDPFVGWGDVDGDWWSDGGDDGQYGTHDEPALDERSGDDPDDAWNGTHDDHAWNDTSDHDTWTYSDDHEAWNDSGDGGYDGSWNGTDDGSDRSAWGDADGGADTGTDGWDDDGWTDGNESDGWSDGETHDGSDGDGWSDGETNYDQWGEDGDGQDGWSDDDRDSEWGYGG